MLGYVQEWQAPVAMLGMGCILLLLAVFTERIRLKVNRVTGSN